MQLHRQRLQLLLLIGVKQSAKPPDEKHPLGYGRAMYFYSFVVAMLLFSGGGVFSIYEGIHKLEHPEPVGDVRLALAGYYQGARAVRERGLFDDTKQYVSVILQLYGAV